MTKHDAERKVRILDFIAATLRARGYPPSVREIAQAVGLASTSAVHHHLQILERDGYLERGDGAEPGHPADADGRDPARPLAASSSRRPRPRTRASCRSSARSRPAARSRPTRTPRRPSSVPDMLAPSGDAYVLRVRGDSMIEAHIADGDFVLIRPQSTARNGDIVVAQVEENAVTLKRFFKEKDKIRLQPANPAYPAAVLRRRPDPGQADRRHPQARLSGGRRIGRSSALARLRALAHAPRVRSLTCSPGRLDLNRSGSDLGRDADLSRDVHTQFPHGR